MPDQTDQPEPDVLEGPSGARSEEIRVERVRRALIGFLHHARRTQRGRAREYAGARLQEARHELEQLSISWERGTKRIGGGGR